MEEHLSGVAASEASDSDPLNSRVGDMDPRCVSISRAQQMRSACRAEIDAESLRTFLVPLCQ